MPQLNPFLPAVNLAGNPKPLMVDFVGDLKVNTIPSHKILNVSASTVIKDVPGFLMTVNVLVAGAEGAIHDCATVLSATAANKIATIPAVVGTNLYQWPCEVGITYIPGAAQVVSISYT